MPCGRRGRNNDVGRVGQQCTLDGIGDFISQLDSSDILCGEG